jgi:hypothetical protein
VCTLVKLGHDQCTSVGVTREGGAGRAVFHTEG